MQNLQKKKSLDLDEDIPFIPTGELSTNVFPEDDIVNDIVHYLDDDDVSNINIIEQ